MRSSLTFAAAIIGVFLQGAHANAARHPDPWEQPDTAAKRAQAVIERCFDHADRTPNVIRDGCVRSLNDACEDEHGTSQHDITWCAKISAEVWEARIKHALDRLAVAKPSETRLREHLPQTRLDLVRSQEMWSDWTSADCKAQVGTPDGSMWSYDLFLCRSDHAASRAIELERLVDWWLS